MKNQKSKIKNQKYNLKLKTIYKIAYFTLCTVILHFALCTLHLPKAFAEGINIKTKPSSFQIRAIAPADIRLPFSITNQGNQSIELTIIVKRFEGSTEENGQLIYTKPGLIDERLKDSFLKNIQVIDNGFVTDSLILSPKQEKILELNLTIPKNTPPQDHYFSLIFLTKPDESGQSIQTDKETVSLVQAGMTLPVLLAIGTNKDKTSFIDKFSAPIFLQSGPVPFTLRIKNSGTHFISPKGVILVKNMFGQTVGRVDIPTTNILAATSRYLSNSSKSPLSPQSPSSPKVYWSEEFLLGFYTANLSLVNHDNELLYTRSIHFMAFPFYFLAGTFIGIILLIIIFRRIKKRLSEE